MLIPNPVKPEQQELTGWNTSIIKGNNRKWKYSIKKENANWKMIRIEKIKIRGGTAEIGFQAEGGARSYCYIDDISLVKTN